MLQLRNISYQIAGKPLFSGINWTISDKQRVALVGPNGAGKTTLLRIIINKLQPTTGDIQIPRNYRIGYLPQEEIAIQSGTILNLVVTGDERLAKLRDRMEHFRNDLENDPGNSDLANMLGQIEHEFSTLGGYEQEAQAKKILAGLGFTSDQFDQLVSEFSGGWQMRAYLARLLIADPDLLLLDEPTNHLDLPSLEWLENYLITFRGTIVFVSHDRYFIDRLSQEIAELWRGRMKTYPGNYQSFIEKKEQERELLIKRAEELKEERARITRFIERFRYKNTKAAQVQSRIKMLEKMESVDIPPERKHFGFRITVPVKSYKEVCTIKSVGFRYDVNWIFRDINLNIYRGEKIALVGVNGAGKTTLTRLITQQLIPQEGELILGERVTTGYYAQHQLEALDLKNSVYQEVYATAADTYRTKIRDVLGIFQFTGDEVDKTIGVLSGGEKARVSLAKILISPVNFLIMDEPTNHLDIQAKEALEQALREYDGTLLIISHDRYFLDRIVSRVIEISEGKLRLFEGNYTDYLKSHEQKSIPRTVNTSLPRDDDTGFNRKLQRRLEAEARQRISGLRRDLNKKIHDLELKIEQLENEKKQIEQKMSDPAFYKNDTQTAETGRRYQDLQTQIPSLVHAWEDAHRELEKIVSSLEKDPSN